ncbi:MAG: fasciclin domain-containing protein [Actinobacteria bacterium]|jgi:Secreted and surface protein containing fasciclin-like repeats|nr:fasciclin domain-containing protein [Actinomycetota bacterium]
MRRTLSIALVAGLTAFTAACGTSEDEPTTTPNASSQMSTATPETSSAAPSESAMSDTKDIVDTAVAAGSFTTLAAALQAAGLVETLKGEGPFTVFAPTDDAFAKLPAGTVDTLLQDPKGDLTSILTYHVVPGKVMAADVLTMNGQKVKTVQGAELTIKVEGEKVMLVDATGASVTVTTPDVAASNGVIHVIDGVLMPK